VLGRGYTCSKHGFHPEGVSAPGDLEQWIRKTMLSGCAAFIDGGGTWPKTHNGWVAG